MITYLLILLVLFTHSVVAMDIHIPKQSINPSPNHSINSIGSDNTSLLSIDIDQTTCTDAGGHCSHHKVHTTGLVSVNFFSEIKLQTVSLHPLKLFTFAHFQAPPLRPPKTKKSSFKLDITS